jgi:serine/threonine-protein kinase RsbW
VSSRKNLARGHRAVDASAGDVGFGTGVVRLRVPARAVSLAMVRSLVGQLSGQVDLDVDAMSDLRLAVDEACSCLVRIAAGEAALNCEFTVSAEMVEVVVSTVADPPEATVNTRGFGWRVLCTLTDHVDVESEVDGPRCRLTIRFTKYRYTADVGLAP